MCGGTNVESDSELAGQGLSPRVRGNRPQQLPVAVAGGSIPACAGEPRHGVWSPRPQKVYPRVCGGTDLETLFPDAGEGLSPRVRGNLGLPAVIALVWGSIPACAGEPAGVRPGADSVPVYPRVCGGTRGVGDVKGVRAGLSPRVRGNRYAST